MAYLSIPKDTESNQTKEKECKKMFKCQVTGKYSRQGKPGTETTQPIAGEKLNKIVVETRQVEYKHWDRENEEEWFSYGTEIVREINATEEGLAVWNSLSPEERAEFVKGLE
jgi:hypothetical protein